METDYPVLYKANQPSSAIHIHVDDAVRVDKQDDNAPFTEEETIHMYLNNVISSAQQVVIFNIADNKPK